MKDQKNDKPSPHEKPLSIIIVDDERQVLTAFARRLRGQDLRIALTIKEAMIHFDCGFVPDVVIADWDLKDGTFGSELLTVVKERFPKARRLLISGNVGKIPAADRASAEVVVGKMSPEMEEVFQELRFGA